MDKLSGEVRRAKIFFAVTLIYAACVLLVTAWFVIRMFT